MALPIREFLMPPYAYTVMYAIFFASSLIMFYGLYRHAKRYGIGAREFVIVARRGLFGRAKRFVRFGIAEEKVLRGGSGGVMHGFVFFGFLMLLAYTTLIFLDNDILSLFIPTSFIQGNFYLTLEFLGDTLGLLFVVGLSIAIYRRFVKRLESLETRWDDYLVLSMLVFIGISGFFVEALRFLVVPSQWATYSPVGDALSQLLNGSAALRAGPSPVYQTFWWMHMVSVFGLLAVAPYTKLVHVFTSGLNIALAPVKPMGRLNTPFSLKSMLETGNADIPPSARRSNDFAPLQLLALDACTNCGRCQEVCPAYASGRDLSPRLIIQDLGRDMRNGGQGDVFSTGVVREDELWACTMCNACVEVCPVFINQIDYIADYRRTLVSENKLDARRRQFLENVANTNNPFGLPQKDRHSWLTDVEVPTLALNPNPEYLYWVGCQSSYDPRGRGVAKAVVKILKAAKVSFAVLGADELCTGEPVRRMGEEGRFQELAMKNIETIRKAKARKVLVHCPHCFNTFRNEYPEFGSSFEVVHHTQLIDELIGEGKLSVGELKGKVTFHDPCNLGRINGVVEPPRSILKTTPGLELVEMSRSKTRSFCCGAGGANAWYQVPEKTKISQIRMEEARSTGAGVVAAACPFCIAMFEDAKNSLPGEPMLVRDVAEIIADALPVG